MFKNLASGAAIAVLIVTPALAGGAPVMHQQFGGAGRGVIAHAPALAVPPPAAVPSAVVSAPKVNAGAVGGAAHSPALAVTPPAAVHSAVVPAVPRANVVQGGGIINGGNQANLRPSVSPAIVHNRMISARNGDTNGPPPVSNRGDTNSPPPSSIPTISNLTSNSNANSSSTANSNSNSSAIATNNNTNNIGVGATANANGGAGGNGFGGSASATNNGSNINVLNANGVGTGGNTTVTAIVPVITLTTTTTENVQRTVVTRERRRILCGPGQVIIRGQCVISRYGSAKPDDASPKAARAVVKKPGTGLTTASF